MGRKIRSETRRHRDAMTAMMHAPTIEYVWASEMQVTQRPLRENLHELPPPLHEHLEHIRPLLPGWQSVHPLASVELRNWSHVCPKRAVQLPFGLQSLTCLVLCGPQGIAPRIPSE